MILLIRRSIIMVLTVEFFLLDWLQMVSNSNWNSNFGYRSNIPIQLFNSLLCPLLTHRRKQQPVPVPQFGRAYDHVHLLWPLGAWTAVPEVPVLQAIYHHHPTDPVRARVPALVPDSGGRLWTAFDLSLCELLPRDRVLPHVRQLLPAVLRKEDG